ncbi:MAG: gluconate 2-dehydrogenase subunit 3 family protein [Gemmatimonadaceae bacterium]|nr:gluconate 2-dehydrogenase subunit 3 family protein [Gemmatimonadaceae bacterium]MCW5827417.1 gluconate 2-dehydrogenase subunit 3 family protein [Gemmatimonadaceae bacterium]
MTLTRRTLLQLAALAAVPSAADAELPDADWIRAAQARLAGSRPRPLPDADRATVAAIADAIIPRTETPGALDVGAPEFIELLLAEWVPEAEREAFANGLAELDERARELHGSAWPGLSTEAATAEIAWAEATVEQPSAGQRALRRVKSWTVHAWITSEVVQKTVIRTNITPGRYEGCVPRPAVGGRR